MTRLKLKLKGKKPLGRKERERETQKEIHGACKEEKKRAKRRIYQSEKEADD